MRIVVAAKRVEVDGIRAVGSDPKEILGEDVPINTRKFRYAGRLVYLHQLPVVDASSEFAGHAADMWLPKA